MTTDFRSELHRLAEDVPQGSPPADLWARGVRRHRRRRTATALAAVAAVLGAVLAGTVGWDALRTQVAQPVVDTRRPAIPDRLEQPSPWLASTADAGPIGPLAAVAGADQNSTWGFETSRGVFGVSAATGKYRFLDLPGLVDSWETSAPGPALSPDGRWVAYLVEQPGHRDRVGGLAVYDTVTGEVTTETIDADLGLDPALVTWVGPGTVLLSYQVITERSGNGWTARFVPDLLWTPAEGSPVESSARGGPTMAAWPVPGGYAHSSSQGLVVRDLADGSRRSSQRLLDRGVADGLAVDPSGQTVVGLPPRPAKDGLTRTLAVGRLAEEPTRLREVRTDVLMGTDGALGWQDAGHLVVRGWDRDRVPGLYAVDVGSGDHAIVVREAVHGTWFFPSYAGELWQNPTVSRPAPEEITDPRLRAAGAATLAVVVVVALWMTRRRREKA